MAADPNQGSPPSAGAGEASWPGRNGPGDGGVCPSVPDAHHIRIAPSPQRVTVKVGATVVAESDRALVLTEGSLVERYYLPRDDVRMDLLEPTASATTCPFKGEASYWSVTLDGETATDVAWCYERPIPSVEAIRGLVCFYNERVELLLDGAPVPVA